MSNLIIFDRSRAVIDWRCPRRRYLNYELDGRGIVQEAEAYELEFGTLIHDSLAAIAKGTGIEDIAPKAGRDLQQFLLAAGKPLDYANEQASLLAGLLRGFHKHVWPRLMAEYPLILAVEQEMTYEYEGIIFMAKPDLVAVDREGKVVYIEYKSTSSKREEWINSWTTAIQLHSTIRAIERALKTEVDAVIVQGLYKGYESYGKQGSPFCYSYRRPGQPPFSKDDIRYDYKPGYQRHPVWLLEGGIASWVEKMPETILADQFPRTPPILVDDDVVEAFFRQRLMREREIDLANSMLALPGIDDDARRAVLDTSFPQRFDQCTPSYGFTCPYRQLCHGHVPDPYKVGFRPRQPHHTLEEAALGSQKKDV